MAPRAGALALSLLSDPLSVDVLRQLEGGGVPLAQLRQAVGSPPQTTMRAHLKVLTEIGVLVRQRQSRFPRPVDYELGGAGRELLGVTNVLESWLQRSPQGQLALVSAAARSTIKVLVQGWSSSIVQALAAGPRSLTELDRSISGLNYPSIERRLASMRDAGLIEAVPGEGPGVPYAVTDWLRQSSAPVAAACSWERRHVRALAPAVGPIDVEAGFLLTLPLFRLPARLSGRCRLAVELENGGGESPLAGVLVELREGRVDSCATNLQGPADASATGSADAWFSAALEGDAGGLEISGERSLITPLLDALQVST